MLVVDDNATNRRICEEMLASWRMKPDVGRRRDGRAPARLARPSIAANRSALVLADAFMPDVDGFALGARDHGNDARFTARG